MDDKQQLPLLSAQPLPGPWRIERNHKMYFAVARETAEGREFLRSASGKPSSFRTYKAALRALAWATEQSEEA